MSEQGPADERKGPRIPQHEPSPADPGREGPPKEWAPGRPQDERRQDEPGDAPPRRDGPAR